MENRGASSISHELRNEVVEELSPDRMSKSRGERDAPLVRGGRNRGMESKKSRRWVELRESREKRSECSTRRSMLVREEGTQRLSKRC
jgi:hypothetical protein